MIYIMSDLHGEYDLFVALMRKIGFTNKDSLYICGDVIEKGSHEELLSAGGFYSELYNSQFL